jgi:hypothetical protein
VFRVSGLTVLKSLSDRGIRICYNVLYIPRTANIAPRDDLTQSQAGNLRDSHGILLPVYAVFYKWLPNSSSFSVASSFQGNIGFDSNETECGCLSENCSAYLNFVLNINNALRLVGDFVAGI